MALSQPRSTYRIDEGPNAKARPSQVPRLLRLLLFLPEPRCVMAPGHPSALTTHLHALGCRWSRLYQMCRADRRSGSTTRATTWKGRGRQAVSSAQHSGAVRTARAVSSDDELPA